MNDLQKQLKQLKKKNKTITGVDKQLVMMIKSYGYTMTSDNIGTYYFNKYNKFSIIRTGDILNFYYNKKNGDSYQLIDSLQGQIMLQVCLNWILSKIREGV